MFIQIGILYTSKGPGSGESKYDISIGIQFSYRGRNISSSISSVK